MTAERGFSGGEVQVFLLMEELRRRGYRGVLLCPGGSRSEAEARRLDLETIAVPADSEWSPRALARTRAALASLRPDLVHLHSARATWLGGLAASSLGLPALTTRRMDRPVKRNWRTRLVYGRAVGRVAAISEAVRHRLLAGGVRAERVRVVPSSVDASRLLPRTPRHEVRAALGAEPGTPVVLAVAAWVRRKGLDVLLEALARIPSAPSDPAPELWLAGEGPERRTLVDTARRCDVADRVRWLGRRDDVPDLLAACDVFALPSRREGLGVAALEAMAAGRAVVASRVGGLAEAVVHESTGLLVPPDDAEALASALGRLLADAGLRERMGAAARERVALCYGASSMVDAYEALYSELLEDA